MFGSYNSPACVFVVLQEGKEGNFLFHFEVPGSCTDNPEEVSDVGSITPQNNVTFYISCITSMNIFILISRVELWN